MGSDKWMDPKENQVKHHRALGCAALRKPLRVTVAVFKHVDRHSLAEYKVKLEMRIFDTQRYLDLIRCV